MPNENRSEPGLTLWPACVRTHPLPQQIEAAGAAGYASIAINSATYRRSLASGFSVSDMVRAVESAGIRFSWVDAVTGWLPVRYPRSMPDIKALVDYDLDTAFEIADNLGCDSLLAIGCFDPGELSVDDQLRAFDSLCGQASARNLKVGLEFIPMWEISDLRAALRLLDGVDSDAAGLVIDTWHFFRSGSDLGMLEKVEDRRLLAIQLADAMLTVSDDGLLMDSLYHRKAPGAGDLDLDAVVRIAARKGVRAFGPEIFSTEMDALSAEKAADVLASCSRRLLSESF